MKIETTPVYPPIPVRSFDWACYDSDSYDADWDGEGYVSTSPRGEGETEEEAIVNWFLSYLDKEGISVSEIMEHRCISDCRRIGCEDVAAMQRRAELQS
jgi:hypothetical protein